jgi:hypothetical protein
MALATPKSMIVGLAFRRSRLQGRKIDADKLPGTPILTSPEAVNPGPVRMK